MSDAVMRFGSLFSGIGGIDLGLERAGMECVWQVEKDEWCRKVLAKHWPDVERFEDVKKVYGLLAYAVKSRPYATVTATGSIERGSGKPVAKDQGRKKENTANESKGYELAPVDVIAGGFPCQPHSVAGKRKGAADDRNLWPEFSRIVSETKPRYVLAENVPGIRTTYLDTVLSDLESQGYACWTFNLPAVAFDAPHRRERIFIVAHANNRRRQQRDEGERRLSELDQNGKGKVGQWQVEPPVGRVANGVPDRVDRLRGLGNAVVPQVAEWIGRRIVEHSQWAARVIGGRR